jgi:hypothetical protein
MTVPLECGQSVGTHMTFVKRSFELFTEGWESHRKERLSFMIRSLHDCFIIVKGASATPGGTFIRHLFPEQL